MLGIVIGAGDILVNRTSKLPILRNLNFFQWWLLLLLSHFSCVRLCDPIDGSPLGSSVPGILQARILWWVAISFSNAWKWKLKVKLLSRARLLATPWTGAYQAPLSMGFSRQEYWSGVPLPTPCNGWREGKNKQTNSTKCIPTWIYMFKNMWWKKDWIGK